MKLKWRRAGDSNPRWALGPYSLNRRAPSASRSALQSKCLRMIPELADCYNSLKEGPRENISDIHVFPMISEDVPQKRRATSDAESSSCGSARPISGENPMSCFAEIP